MNQPPRESCLVQRQPRQPPSSRAGAPLRSTVTRAFLARRASPPPYGRVPRVDDDMDVAPSATTSSRASRASASHVGSPPWASTLAANPSARADCGLDIIPALRLQLWTVQLRFNDRTCTGSRGTD